MKVVDFYLARKGKGRDNVSEDYFFSLKIQSTLLFTGEKEDF